MTTATKIKLGNQVWKEPEDSSETFRDAYKRITGVEFNHSAVLDEEPIEGDGTYMLMPSGYVIWVSHDSSEIFAPCTPDTEPVTTDDAEPVSEDVGKLMTEFADLETQRRDLEEQLEKVKKQQDALQDPLAEAMGLNGIQNARVNGYTIYKKTNRFVSKPKEVEAEAVCSALQALGLSYMVKEGYNANSLKSKIKEYQDQWAEKTEEQRAMMADAYTDTGIPKSLYRLLNIGEKIVVEARKA